MLAAGLTGIDLPEVLDCRRDVSGPWRQLVVTSTPVPVAPPTRFANSPYDDDAEGRYRCPLGHTAGLNILSEVTVRRDAWDGSDVVRTREYVGSRLGLLVPRPLILISQRVYRLLRELRATGFRVEVAHLA